MTYRQLSKKFREHIRFFFDNTSQNELILKEVFKKYITPYEIEVFDACGIADSNDVGYDELYDNIGKDEAFEWFEVLCRFVSDEIGDFTLEDGNKLYPGFSKKFVINRDWKMYMKP